MDRDEQLSVVSVVWPTITTADLVKLAGHLPGHSGEVTVVWQSERPMAAACLVRFANGSDAFIKRYSPALVSAAELSAKHVYVNALVDEGFPTVPFLAFTNGTTVINVDGWLYEVSLRAPGEDRYRETYTWQPPHSRAEARELGRIVAALRSASDPIPVEDVPSSPYQTRVRLVLGDPLPRADAWLKDHPAVAAYIERTGRDFVSDLRVVRPFAERLTPLADAPMRWTHGDLHVSNTLWRGDRIASVIDFGLASVNPALLDLAIAIERHAIDWLAIFEGDSGAYRPEVATDIIAGYREASEVTGAEVELLPDLLAVCQTEFALANIEYDELAPVPDSYADWAYDIAFNGHQRWFASDDGRHFSDVIRRAFN